MGLFTKLCTTMNSVLILVFNILASSQAKPDAATNMVIEHAKISMPADNSGGGDYASVGNKDTNVNINKASIVMAESSGGGGGDYASQGNQDTNLRINKANIHMEDSTGESGIGKKPSAGDYLRGPRPTWSTMDYLLNRRRPVPVIETNDYVNGKKR